MKTWILCLLWLLTSPAYATEDDLYRLFQGSFDNFLQTKLDESHSRIHADHVPLKVQGANGPALYVRQYTNGEKEEISNLEIFLFHTKRDGTVSVEVGRFLNWKAWTQKPTSVQSVSMAEIEIIDGCTLTFRPLLDRSWIGQTTPHSCVKDGLSTEVVFTVSAERLTIYQEIRNQDGQLLQGRRDQQPANLLRGRPFKCWAVVRDKEDPNSPWSAIQDMQIDDQGGRFDLIDLHGENDISVSLAQVVYAERLPVLKLGLHNRGESATFSYIWGESDATRLGVNLGWVQAGCQINTDPL